jgi:hypothetical protein
VADVIVVTYLLGWPLASVALAVLSWLVNSRLRPAPNRLAASLLAGAAWPFLVLGAAQFGAVVALSKALAQHQPGLAVIPPSVDELV